MAKAKKITTGKKAPKTPVTAITVAPVTAITKPRMADPRMPPVGTVLRVTRGGKELTATIRADGIGFNGAIFKSLSGAATAAAESLGLAGAQNGFVFWGIQKAAGPQVDPVEAVTKAMARVAQALARCPADKQDAAKDALRSGIVACGFGPGFLTPALPVKKGKAKTATA
jgi:hypothetical protein